MDIRSRLRRISNSYYNLGLAQAKERNLSSALESLRKALQLNKKNIDARNLYGLIMFEMGEEGEALVSWVISMNYQGTQNAAQRYMAEIRRRASYLETSQIAIAKYNQALSQLRMDNEDKAVVALVSAVDERPNYVRANMLLALLYMKRNHIGKAKRYLSNVLAVDRYNKRALGLMHALGDKKASAKKRENAKKEGDLLHGRKMLGDEVVVPGGRFRNYSGLLTAVNLGIGLLIGAASVLFLYMPATSARMNSIHNKEITAVSQRLNDANMQVDNLNTANEDLKTQVDQLTEVNNTTQENMNYKLLQYVLLTGIVNDTRNKDFLHASEIFANIDPGQLTDVDNTNNVSVIAIYADVAPKLREEGFALLEKAGDTLAKQGDYPGAITNYDLALKIKPDYAMAIYKKAIAYKTLGDLDTANALFGEVINNFPTEKVAEDARRERGF